MQMDAGRREQALVTTKGVPPVNDAFIIAGNLAYNPW